MWLYDVGMPIGNLTSQLFANIYLNELDQLCKHELRLHFYIRYMDDVIILLDSKERLAEIKGIVEDFLNENLHLDLNKKTAIRPVWTGVDFVGFRIFGHAQEAQEADGPENDTECQEAVRGNTGGQNQQGRAIEDGSLIQRNFRTLQQLWPAEEAE